MDESTVRYISANADCPAQRRREAELEAANAARSEKTLDAATAKAVNCLRSVPSAETHAQRRRPMTAATNSSALHQIGETAGVIWKALSKNGPLSVTKLAEKADVNRDLFMQALGWLAREDKIDISESKRGRIVSLKAEA
jgi:winged helix-turn-helix protein DUF2582